MPSVLAMLQEMGYHDDDWNAAADAYVKACKTRDKAFAAYEAAERVMQQREAEMRALYDHLTASPETDSYRISGPDEDGEIVHEHRHGGRTLRHTHADGGDSHGYPEDLTLLAGGASDDA